MWYLLPIVTNAGTNNQWKPGHLYITDKRLCWWYDFDKKLLLDIPTDKIMHVTVEKSRSDPAQKNEKFDRHQYDLPQ